MAINSDFEALLSELMATRRTYEQLRTTDGPLAERASTLNRLHQLRSQIAGIRTAH